jgi:hypothetical protein
MMNSELIASILRASLISIVPFGIWAWLYLNPKKTWFFQTSTTSVVFGVARFWYYVSPFLGVAFLFFGVSDWQLGQDPHSLSIWLFVGIGCIMLGFVLGFLQPSWLSPPWLRRLKREHGDVIDLLLEDTVGMDKYELERRLETWEAIEKWVAEVRRKHGL